MTTSKVSGRIVDRKTKAGIAEALIIVLRPGVSTAEFARQQKREMALSSTRSDKDGRFALPDPLPGGATYSIVVVAKNYKQALLDESVRIGEDPAPEIKLVPIRLDPTPGDK